LPQIPKTASSGATCTELIFGFTLGGEGNAQRKKAVTFFCVGLTRDRGSLVSNIGQNNVMAGRIKMVVKGGKSASHVPL